MLLVLAIPAVCAAASPSGAPASPPERTGFVPATLYLHEFGPQDAPMNTQVPDPAFRVDASLGLATYTVTCVQAPTEIGLVGHRYHTSYGYHADGLVEYNVPKDEGRLGLPYRRPLAYDAELDASVPAVFHWYATVRPGPADSPADGTAIVPEVSVHVTVRTGERLTVTDEGYNEGRIVAEGETPPALLAGSRTTGANASTLPDGTVVYEFVVPLDWQQASIPRLDGFNVRVDMVLKVPGCDGAGQSFMTNSVRAHSSDGHRPRLEWSVESPLRIDPLRLSSGADGLVIVTNVTSVWGSYDVRQGPRLQIHGPGTNLALEPVAAVRPGEDNPGSVPYQLAWLWNETGVAVGTYNFTVEATNLQGTASVIASSTLSLGEAPVLALGAPLAGLLALVAAAWARRW